MHIVTVFPTVLYSAAVSCAPNEVSFWCDDAAVDCTSSAAVTVAEDDGCDPELTVQLSSGFYRGAPSPSARLLRASYSITSW
uniref:Putative secreted protein n=1 Tax=Anopheles marajoara TaxID=58244 RepID=A0A2M4CBP6_9DIPT